MSAISDLINTCEENAQEYELESLLNVTRNANLEYADMCRELTQLRAAVAERDAAIERARAEEREACIVALDELHTESDDEYYTLVAAKAAIRARGEKVTK